MPTVKGFIWQLEEATGQRVVALGVDREAELTKGAARVIAEELGVPLRTGHPEEVIDAEQASFLVWLLTPEGKRKALQPPKSEPGVM
jgi:hypothetical protein